jgi:SAM-dependent methyltransferase
MDLTKYRRSDAELERTADLMRLVPDGDSVLDVGAREGYFSELLAEKYKRVVALDLEKPDISFGNIECVKGDATGLKFAGRSFDLVFCAEVLEHIPALEKACSELGRVSKKYLLIGVPYRQDIRLARTTCQTCGKKNPPWSHVNSFDEKRLTELFPGFKVKEKSFIGNSGYSTNALSAALMDLAGNPYGTYNQEEPCLYCNNHLKAPVTRGLLQKVCTKLAVSLNNIQRRITGYHANWIHVLFEKDS